MSKKCVVNITTPDSKEGELHVWNGTTEVANGMKVAAGTKLTITATPTDKYKLTAILVNDEKLEGTELTIEGDVTISATFEKKDPNALDYAIPSEADNQRTFNASPSRLIHSITINGATVDGADAPFFYKLNNENGQKEVYIDATTETVNVTAGDNIDVIFDDDIIWMHYYVYIDYNHDGVFDPATELVSYSYLNGKNSNGDSVNNGPDSNLPAFQIKADATPVKTRMRIKTDWDSDCPTGNPTQSIGGNGGTIVDFNIDIHELKQVTYPLHITTSEGGTLAVVDAMTQQEYKDGDQVPEGSILVLTATPDEGYRLVDVYYNGSPLVGDMIIVEGETALSAEFSNGVLITFNQPDHCVVTVADGNSNPVDSGDFIDKGGDLLVFFNLDANYELVSVEVNGEDKFNDLIGGSMLMLFGVKEDVDIVSAVDLVDGITNAELNGAAYDAASQSLVLPEGSVAHVYNAAGQQVMSVKGGVVSVANLQSGCYVVRIEGEAGVHTFKFIKK